MDSHFENKLYERFPDLYRERTAPLESSNMPWGVQCGNGWYKIIYDLCNKITKIAPEGEHSPAISQIARHDDGTLYVDVRNVSPPIADLVATAREASRLTCEYCSYSPAFLRDVKQDRKQHIACGRCVNKTTGTRKPMRAKRKQKPRRAPDVMVVKR